MMTPSIFRKGVLLLFSAVCLSCNENQEQEINGQLIVPYTSLNDVFLESYFENIDFVKLEDRQEALLKNIGRIIVQGDSLIVQTDNQITFFDGSGNYLGRLNEQGLGPSEYDRIADFQINNDEIILLDNKNSRLLIFDLKNLSHQKTIPLRFQGASSFELYDKYYIFHKSNKMNVLNSGKDSYEILITDLNGDIVKGYLPIDNVNLGESRNLFALDRPFGKNKNEILYANGFRNDSIYILSPDEIESKLLLFPDRPNLQETFGKPLYEFTIQELVQENNKVHIGPFFNFLTDKSLSFVYLYDQKFIWNYTQNDKTIFTVSQIRHEITGIPIMPPTNYSKGSFISVLNSDWLERVFAGEFENAGDDLVNSLNSIYLNDLNPMLVIYNEKL